MIVKILQLDELQEQGEARVLLADGAVLPPAYAGGQAHAGATLSARACACRWVEQEARLPRVRRSRVTDRLVRISCTLHRPDALCIHLIHIMIL